MRFVWLGFHAEGLPALEALLEARAPIRGVLTLRPELAANRSGVVDLRPICDRYGIPLYFIANVNEPDAREILGSLEPDVVFVIGWHQIVRPPALRLARLGMIGAHASLLPHNRGSAPINWSLIRGEVETGNTLFWLGDEVDAGDLIDQRAFPISPYDTCRTLYERVAASNRDMLVRLLPRLLAGERPGRAQLHTDEPVLRRRRPADGLIDWTAPSRTVYDFIRGLARPYPGAFSGLDGRAWRIWHAALPPAVLYSGRTPGEVIGPVVSPEPSACGQLVACGQGAVILLELEGKDGAILQGRLLSDQLWNGRRFGE